MEVKWVKYSKLLFHGYKLDLVRRSLMTMMTFNRGQRSTEAKCDNFGQIYRYYKVRMMTTFMKDKGHPKVIKGQNDESCHMAFKLYQKNH